MDRIRSAWNAFTSADSPENDFSYSSVGYGGSSPSRNRPLFSVQDRTILASIYTRISVDISMIRLRHIKLDEMGRYDDDIDSRLNDCLTTEPNLDQGPNAFIQDIVLSLFDGGVSAVVPVDTTINPNTNATVDICSLRVGRVIKWLPDKVRVEVYDEREGRRREVTLSKRFVAIVENPLYPVMNEENSTLRRLFRKLSLLDSVEEHAASGKLDIIVQLPFPIRSESQEKRAEKRKLDIEFQLKNNRYGVAYIDGTEKIIQLNRPAENSLQKTIEQLLTMLYGQLGITEDVMNGTADEKTMLNYFNRTVWPIMESIVQAMQRSFIGSPVRKREKVAFFKDLFSLVPIAELAEAVDKLARNEIVSGNEVRQIMGLRPHKDPKADQLINSNMPVKDTRVSTEPVPESERNSQNGT